MFLVVVRPAESDDYVNDTWQGTVNQIATITRKQVSNLQSDLVKRMDKQQRELGYIKDRLEQLLEQGKKDSV